MHTHAHTRAHTPQVETTLHAPLLGTLRSFFTLRSAVDLSVVQKWSAEAVDAIVASTSKSMADMLLEHKTVTDTLISTTPPHPTLPHAARTPERHQTRGPPPRFHSHPLHPNDPPTPPHPTPQVDLRIKLGAHSVLFPFDPLDRRSDALVINLGKDNNDRVQ